MNKSFTLLALLLVIAVFANAQVTVTNASWPKSGDTMKIATDYTPDYLLVPSQTTNGTWDFSGLKKDTIDNLIFYAASTGSNFSSFPNAELYTNSDQGEAYYNVTNNVFEVLGFVGDLGGFGFPLVAKIVPGQVERRNPMKYFDINNTNYSFGATFSASFLPDSLFSGLPIKPDSVRFGQSVSRQDVVDSWGKLKIPGGTYDVLREKRTSISTLKLEIKIPFIGWLDVTSSFGGGLGADTSVVYQYLANGSKEPIMVLNCNSLGDTIQGIDFKSNVAGVGFFDPSNPIAKLKVYPNPASKFIQISTQGITEGSTNLVITDMLGKIVRTESNVLNNEPYIWYINLDNFDAGMYFVSLKDKNGQLKAAGTFSLVK
ncbi:MAG: T9SS type A sorting domain-containing protein [Saprospiraceae bacterium]|jgi:hypothetical protein|nr:T9SS type A sorting domain-containing protein [Saprospiraceae bacterium]